MRKDFLPKYSNDLPHHYFFGVAIHPATSSKAGKHYLKYGPIYIHNEDIDRIICSMVRMNDEVFKQTPKEALEIEGCSELANIMSAMKISANVNNCTLHHISSKDIFDEETISLFVEFSNDSEDLKKKLLESRI